MQFKLAGHASLGTLSYSILPYQPLALLSPRGSTARGSPPAD